MRLGAEYGTFHRTYRLRERVVVGKLEPRVGTDSDRKRIIEDKAMKQMGLHQDRKIHDRGSLIQNQGA